MILPLPPIPLALAAIGPGFGSSGLALAVLAAGLVCGGAMIVAIAAAGACAEEPGPDR